MTDGATWVDAIRLTLDGLPADEARCVRPLAGVRTIERARTTLHYVTLDGPAGRRPLVVKIKRYPAASDGASDERPGDRARREYDALVEVHRHFSRDPDPHLGAVEPVAFLPGVGGIVMGRVPGRDLYRTAMPLRSLAGGAGLRGSLALLTSTGRWLRRLHGIRPNGLVPRETVQPADARRGIRQELDRLERSGAPLDRGWWTRQLDRLGPDDPLAASVWLHGDFHLGNVQVGDDGRVVALDTALLRRGSADADVGKFLADLKTRRGRILRRGRFPGRGTMYALERAFLEGYFGADTSPDLATLRLFEGWYLLRKWRRVRTDAARGVSAAGRAADALLRRLAIDPAYRRITNDWAESLPTRKSRKRG